MSRLSVPIVFLCATLTNAHLSAWAVTIDTVFVGNVGNPTDPLAGNLYGRVNYKYTIGTTEVTNDQYSAFLNAKAKEDPLGLYNNGMGSNPLGGITQNGLSGNFSYSIKPNMGNKPVNFVNWYDAVRFSNWLNNGQGNGDTESGAYTLLGGTPDPSNGNNITRNIDAAWFLPSENEWYKAAYYQPATQGGDADSYWSYPTRSNSTPTAATANSVGDVANPGANVVTYGSAASWNSRTPNLTTVGSAGPMSQSFYGTSDQGGNVWEWNEGAQFGIQRETRGGSTFNGPGITASGTRNFINPLVETENIGFRVASVPEPSTLALATLGALALLAINRRRSK
jgi:sulfatase modifying factor 1